MAYVTCRKELPALLCAAVLLPALVGACGDSPGSNASSGTTEEYRDGLEAEVFEPAEPVGAPVVLLIPGGGWVDSDRTGLAPLAAALADRGAVVVNATYRAAGAGGDLASMVGDVRCATRFAARRAAEISGESGPIVAIGHSAGAHLVALSALAGDAFAPSCPDPEVELAGFAGLAGPYDVSLIPEVAQPLFGATLTEDPALWRSGNPLTYASAAPDVAILLVHGSADELVGVEFTEQFADALRAGGHTVVTRIVDGATHLSIFEPEQSADLIADWLTGIASAR